MKRKDKPILSIVQEGDCRVSQFVAGAAETEALRFVETCDLLRSRCESPIEELLAVALYDYSRTMPEKLFFCGLKELPEEPDFDEAAFVFNQVAIGRYRVDFAIWDATLSFNHTPPRVMIIECDGHDFHEKTKEQARRDKQRDRFLVSKGHKVLRFTGSEIWASPEDVADEIINELACNDAWRNRG